MLTSKTFNLLRRNIRMFEVTGLLPLHWNPTERRLQVRSPYSFRFLPFWIMTIYVFSYSVLNVYAGAYLDWGKASTLTLIVNVMFAVGFPSLGIFNLSILFHAEEICFVVNALIQFDAKASQRFKSPATSKSFQLLDFALLCGPLVSASMMPALMFFFFAYPGENRYYLRHILGGRRPEIHEVLLWSPVEAWTYYGDKGCLLPCFQVMFMSCLVTNHWIEKLIHLRRQPVVTFTEASDSSTSATTPSAAGAEESIHYYRMLSIINTVYNNAMAGLPMLGITIFFTFIHTIMAFTTIKFAHAIPMPAFLIFPYFSIFAVFQDFALFKPMGQVQEVSREFIESLRDCWEAKEESLNGRSYIRRELRSLRPLSVKIGSVYQVHKTTVLFVIMGVCNAVINASLMF